MEPEPSLPEVEHCLFDASRNGDADTVQRLLREGVDPNIIEAHDRWLDEKLTPLMVAASSSKSNAATVQNLLDGGANPFALSAARVPAIWYAAGGMPPSVDTGCALQASDKVVQHKGGDAKRLKILLDVGSDPNATAPNGRTAFGEACQAGDPERMQLLIERGATVWPQRITRIDVTQRVTFRETEFVSQTQESNNLLDEFLQEQFGLTNDEVAATSKQEGPALANSHGEGYEPYAVPLFQAAGSGDTRCVSIVLDQGFPINFRCEGRGVLDFAGSREVVEFLWNHGLRPQEGAWGFDAVGLALEDERYDAARFMLERLTDKQGKKEYLLKLLNQFSGFYMDPVAVKMLLEFGASPSDQLGYYGNAVHSACWHGECEDSEDSNRIRGTLEALFAAGASINGADGASIPIIEAAYGDWGSPTAVSVLIERGANVNAKDSSGMTALMYAASRGEVECVILLIQAGADQALTDNRGKSAVDFAKQHLEDWQSIASDPEKYANYKDNVEAAKQRHQETLARAERALSLLEVTR